MLNLTRLHLGIAHESQFQGLGIRPQKDLVEKSFDLEPRQLQSAIETGSFEITEMFDQSMIKKPSLVVRFSTLGLSANVVALESKCASKSNPNQ